MAADPADALSMSTHANQARTNRRDTLENKSRAPGSAAPKAFADQRTATFTQLKLAAAADTSSSVQQVLDFQEMADGGPQSGRVAQLQAMADAHAPQPRQQESNTTGIPDRLKSSMEQLSSLNLGDVTVHYNSPRPAQLHAHAYAQGSEIHFAPGQEKHLPHELGHVVQQKQGRVRPTMRMHGVAINSDASLESEADALGAQALQMSQSGAPAHERPAAAMHAAHEGAATPALQRMGKGDDAEDEAGAEGGQDFAESTLDNEAQDQYEAVTGIRLAYRTAIGETMIATGMVPKPAVPTGYLNLAAWNPWKRALRPDEIGEVIRFETVVWTVTNDLLPPLLGNLPFENALAAIRFAQDIFAKFLVQRPDLLAEKDLEGVLRAHLQAVIDKLPTTEGETEEEDDHADTKTDLKIDAKNDKRYKAAVLRIQAAKDGSAKELTLAEQAGKKHAAQDQRTFEAERALFEKRFAAKNRQAFDIVCDYAAKMTHVIGYRFLRLLNLHADLGGNRADFTHELHLIFHNGSGVAIPSHTAERLAAAKHFIALGLLAEGVEENNFNTGYGSRNMHGAIAPTDLEIENRRRVTGREMAELIIKDKAAKKVKDKENKEKMEGEHAALVMEVPEQVFGSLAEVDASIKSPSAVSNLLLRIVIKAGKALEKGSNLLEDYEDYFAHRGWQSGNSTRLEMVSRLGLLKLLPGIDQEILKFGARSNKSLVAAAVSGGWLTSEEEDIASKLLGPKAFVGILDSHMRRGKPGPLRAMIEQIRSHRDLVRFSPPLTSTSLMVDTNIVEILVTPFSALSLDQEHLRVQLNNVIEKERITDVRLANMNIAELSGFGRLIGTVINVQLNDVKGEGSRTIPLSVLGVPYNASRGSGKYDEVFNTMKEKKVGEHKGDADRSMMADIYMAEREEGAVAHFATADLGVAEEIGEESGKFNPRELGLPDVSIHTMRQRPQPKSAPKETASTADRVEKTGKKHPIWDFPVGEAHTVIDITRLIAAAHFDVFIVGGAVRDFIRGAKFINDVDMKTNMPVDQLVALLEKQGMAVAVTPAIKLVKVGQDDKSADIVSTALTASGTVTPEIDRMADALTRDFSLNALYLDPTRPKKTRDQPLDPLGAEAHVQSGLLRFSADPGDGATFQERAQAILRHLEQKPENFGRALKFLERGHKEWEEAHAKFLADKLAYDNRPWRNARKNKKKQMVAPTFAPKVYHLDANILDLLRKNAIHILQPLTAGDKAPGKKGLFIHQSGFKSPMELVDVMRRLNFPPEAIQMVYPDKVAGTFDNQQQAYSRNVSPRARSTGPVEAWDPAAAPSVKVDTITGRIYQYRMYACVPATDPGEKPASSIDEVDSARKILIDVDYSDHGVRGHPSPHYHVYRMIDRAWKKKESGYSNTGQPGEPPVSFVNGWRQFTGPVTWTWWTPGKDKNDDDGLRKALQDAAARSGIAIDTTDASTINIGGQITLPLVRIRELAKNKRMPKLLSLVYNLERGVPWNADDDTVQELTGSKDSRERLRFRPQLAAARAFLTDDCGIEDPDKLASDGKLNDRELERIYDLRNANHSREACLAASRFAMDKLKNKGNAFDFVNYFEFYIAAAKNKVSRIDMELLYSRTANHAGHAMVGAQIALTDEDHEKEVRAKAHTLTFKDDSTAVYHLHKHLDMVPQSMQEIQKTNRDMMQAGQAYMAICHATVAQGEHQKTVAESVHTKKFYFVKGNTVAIVEVDTANNQAYLLTCYNTNVQSPIFLTTAYTAETDARTGPKATLPEAQANRLYRTPFGSFVKEYTPPDGNCFFHAVQRSARLGVSHSDLRKLAVSELRANFRRTFNGTHYTDFITRQGTEQEKATASADYLAVEGNWARDDGDLVPELMARALGRTIHILAQSTGMLVQTMGPPDTRPIYIFYNGATHYETALVQG